MGLGIATYMQNLMLDVRGEYRFAVADSGNLPVLALADRSTSALDRWGVTGNLGYVFVEKEEDVMKFTFDRECARSPGGGAARARRRPIAGPPDGPDDGSVEQPGLDEGYVGDGPVKGHVERHVQGHVERHVQEPER